ncbi:alternative ribosome rescue factor ArfA [Salinicola tamaricis]|uniref:alternative ribosome rescue factor ArfA n=1 Tax=Salinicola tamaricis TaxID=1771309 RepID=UPI001F5C4F0F|nr:alternative ribosome rescue factor ArfA [Salinicola tamaricis]
MRTPQFRQQQQMPKKGKGSYSRKGRGAQGGAIAKRPEAGRFAMALSCHPARCSSSRYLLAGYPLSPASARSTTPPAAEPAPARG